MMQMVFLNEQIMCYIELFIPHKYTDSWNQTTFYKNTVRATIQRPQRSTIYFIAES